MEVRHELDFTLVRVQEVADGARLGLTERLLAAVALAARVGARVVHVVAEANLSLIRHTPVGTVVPVKIDAVVLGQAFEVLDAADGLRVHILSLLDVLSVLAELGLNKCDTVRIHHRDHVVLVLRQQVAVLGLLSDKAGVDQLEDLEHSHLESDELASVVGTSEQNGRSVGLLHGGLSLLDHRCRGVLRLVEGRG